MIWMEEAAKAPPPAAPSSPWQGDVGDAGSSLGRRPHGAGSSSGWQSSFSSPASSARRDGPSGMGMLQGQSSQQAQSRVPNGPEAQGHPCRELGTDKAGAGAGKVTVWPWLCRVGTQQGMR